MKALAGAAIGAGVVATTFSAAWWISERHRPREAYALTYTKAGGTISRSTGGRLADDPTDVTVPATRYASFIASKCRLEQWTMANNASDSDAPEAATLKIPAGRLSNRQFNCLATFVRPEYVTLTRTTY